MQRKRQEGSAITASPAQSDTKTEDADTPPRGGPKWIVMPVEEERDETEEYHQSELAHDVLAREECPIPIPRNSRVMTQASR